MTLFGLTIERCAVCNAHNFHSTLESTNSTSTDLDSRPVGMARGTMSLWVFRCRKCGYCAPSLKILLPQAKQTVNSEAFQSLRTAKEYPNLANDFLSLAMVQEYAGNYFHASSSALSAAWVCDDKKKALLAEKCRRKAIILFAKSRDSGYQDCPNIPFDDDGTNEVILADLLRRVGDFDASRKVSLEGYLKKPVDKIAKTLDFEMLLADKQDRDCHTVEEVFNSNIASSRRVQLGCVAQLICVITYFGAMLYAVINYPEWAELVIFGGIILFILIIGSLDYLDKILFTKPG